MLTLYLTRPGLLSADNAHRRGSEVNLIDTAALSRWRSFHHRCVLPCLYLYGNPGQSLPMSNLTLHTQLGSKRWECGNLRTPRTPQGMECYMYDAHETCRQIYIVHVNIWHRSVTVLYNETNELLRAHKDCHRCSLEVDRGWSTYFTYPRLLDLDSRPPPPLPIPCDKTVSLIDPTLVSHVTTCLTRWSGNTQIWWWA